MKPKSKQIKVICRKLPPKLTAKQFNDQFQPYAKKSSFTYFVSGDHKYFLITFRDVMKCTHSTGYLTFDSESTFKQFQTEHNGHIFLDEKGNTYKMQVEQAIWQKAPKKQTLPETSGTYQSKEDYKEFAERVGKEVEMAVRVDQLEEEKEEHRVASLVSELNDHSTKKRHQKSRRTQKVQKEEIKYVIKKRPQQKSEVKGEEILERKFKAHHKGKGPTVIYRKKQPKEDQK